MRNPEEFIIFNIIAGNLWRQHRQGGADHVRGRHLLPGGELGVASQELPESSSPSQEPLKLSSVLSSCLIVLSLYFVQSRIYLKGQKPEKTQKPQSDLRSVRMVACIVTIVVISIGYEYMYV